ncbi:alanine/ornithine racemase family PLP-dependent enzyme [Sporosarcina sp. Sa2YVA2]|uniref:Alanine/ornithine racemase family PLP-dependent enzyme n=1 Tax=Sporosarcina quadrami TaxID=2762234 RepID=A0ABR8U8Y4_9BACL|nr:alanine/ornithine racemase family PLP-dependent enzyme [Sporosarcina quadrami]MBD7984492.1 alanine/ornithine racemase family PLP-dependent enzyme [Sporosarcina quadrami]
MYPIVYVNKEHLLENVRSVTALCATQNIEVTGVTKVFAGDPEIARIYVEGGIRRLGDSRVENLKQLQGLDAEKWLIRPPMIDEIEALVAYADASLNSELETIQAINDAALKAEKVHNVILMVDLGDIREGFIDHDELVSVAIETEKMRGVHLYGIGVNLTCFSFVQSDKEKMSVLSELAEVISNKIGRKLDIVSGGNSATLDLMLKDGIPGEVTNLRLGESLLFGKERAHFTFLPDTHQDVFTLACQIVEVKEKPSVPWGEIGVDSYGNSPTFIDRGIRKKAICAIGKQDFDVETSTAIDQDLIVLGASSDHLMLDVTDCEKAYKVGDIIEFQLGYFSTMRAYTSKYVTKKYF